MAAAILLHLSFCSSPRNPECNRAQPDHITLLSLHTQAFCLEKIVTSHKIRDPCVEWVKLDHWKTTVSSVINRGQFLSCVGARAISKITNSFL